MRVPASAIAATTAVAAAVVVVALGQGTASGSLSPADPTTAPAPSTVSTSAPATTAAAPTTAQVAPATVAPLVRGGRFAYGDSVMLGAKPALNDRSFSVNAKESRQFGAAVSAMRDRAAAGTLPRNVVVHLGTNGTITLADCKAVVKYAGTGRTVFYVTVRVPRSWQASNNRTLRACDAAFAADRVQIIDWYRLSAGKTAWFYSDGIHLTAKGRTAYAGIVDAAVDRLGR